MAKGDKEYDFHRVMEAGSRGENFIQERSLRKVLVLDRFVCMTKVDGKLYATKIKCPHSGGPIHEGWLNESNHLVCPLHRFQFSLETGRETSGEGFYLETYPVEVRDGYVYVGFERRKFLGIF